jgi:chromosomal replication initiator protein
MIHDLSLGYGAFNAAALYPPRIDLTVRHCLTVARIQAVVADYYGISVIHMKSPERYWAVSHPRQVAMYLTRKLLRKSLQTTAQLFGKKDHATVFHAVRAVEKRMAEDDLLARDVAILRERLSQ